jgi:cobalt-precorrin-5B (C1)-methyltransferase
MSRKPQQKLRQGWTTGACATAATRAALTALITGEFPDPVTITLPKGQTPAFALAREGKSKDWACASIIKDAGDDPDVTHQALITSTVRFGETGSGIIFKAGKGVGMVTKAGLPIAPGNPAINPVPRLMMQQVVEEIALKHGVSSDVEIEISVADGETLAQKTWNPRLGIIGGISILGTTGIVHPFSCSAWIHSIHSGIDVARANGFDHMAGATGSTSEAVVKKLYNLPDFALIDMGDFAGGMLKYLRRNPVPKVTIAGGFGKLTKLAQGYLDLHSGRSQVSFDWLADAVEQIGGSSQLQEQTRQANTSMEVLTMAQKSDLPLAQYVADKARMTALDTLRGAPIEFEVIVIDRNGGIVGRAN